MRGVDGDTKTFFRGFKDGQYSMTYDGIPFNDTNDPTHHSWVFFPAQTIGSTRMDHVICYCGSGVTACQNLLALEHAGLRGAKLYAGSWSEWSADPSRPVERG